MRVVVERAINADPTGVALLVAGPGGVELWPGSRPAGGAGVGSARVHLVEPLCSGAESATGLSVDVTVEPPQRTPTSFVVPFGFRGEAVPATAGTLRLEYAPTDRGVPRTRAVLEFGYAGASPAGLRALAEGFLENLAVAAESRSRAA
jgi:hypothetical protein